MAFVSAIEFLKQGENADRVRSFEDVCISINRTGDRNQDKWSLVVALSTAIAKKAKFMRGDKVNFLWDAEKKVGLICRVTDGGWALTSGGKRVKGKYYFKMYFKEGMPNVAHLTGCPSEVTSEGIEFIFPDDVSFTGNKRRSSKHDRTV